MLLPFKRLLLACTTIITLTACGGSGGGSSNSKANVTINVADYLSASKKSKADEDIQTISVTDLAGNPIEGVKDLGGRKFSISIENGESIVIKITLKNADGEIVLEKIIENASSGTYEVDEDSTSVAALVRENAESNNQDLNEYLDENEGDTDKVKDLLDNVNKEDFIERILSSNDDKNLEELSDKLEDAIKELERIKNILERIQNRINHFQNGTQQDDEDEDSSTDLSLEQFAEQFAEHNEYETNNTSINIDEDGEIYIEKEDEVERFNPENELEKAPVVSGKVVSSSENGLALLIRRDSGDKTIELVNDGTIEVLTKLLNNIHPGDRLIVKYKENAEGQKVIVNIKGGGKTTGIIKSKTEISVTVTDENGYETEFSARYLNNIEDSDDEEEAEEENKDEESTETTEENETNESTEPGENTNRKAGFEPSVLRTIASLKVGDKVKIKWKINERKRIQYIEKANEEGGDESENEEDESTDENEENEEGEEENNETNSITITGSVLEKTEGGFRLSSSNESALILIDTKIAYHKEILAGLLAGDTITVTAKKLENKYVLTSATGEGTMTGTVLEKTETAIWVKDAEGRTVKFTPEWHDGGLDADMLATFASLTVGQTITVKWLLEERKRAISIAK